MRFVSVSDSGFVRYRSVASPRACSMFPVKRLALKSADVVADVVRAVMAQRVGEEPAAVAGGGRLRRGAILRAGADEVHADALDAIVEVPGGEAAPLENVPAFNRPLAEVERSLPEAARDARSTPAVRREPVGAGPDALVLPGSPEIVAVRVLADGQHAGRRVERLDVGSRHERVVHRHAGHVLEHEGPDDSRLGRIRALQDPERDGLRHRDDERESDSEPRSRRAAPGSGSAVS